jgi:ABC-2 type transport system permease protein
MLIFLITLEVFFKAPPLIFLGALVLSLPGVVFMNYLGLLIDLLKPKLIWDNELRAVKQNLNTLPLVFGGMILAVALVILGALFLKTPLAAFLILFLVTGAVAAAMTQLVLTIGEEKMEKLNA